MNKEKLINWIILILAIAFLAGCVFIISMPSTAHAHYGKLESLTPQAIEKRRVDRILQ